MKRLKPLAVFLLSLLCILAVIWVTGEMYRKRLPLKRRVKIIFRTNRCGTRSGTGSTPEHHPQYGR